MPQISVRETHEADEHEFADDTCLCATWQKIVCTNVWLVVEIGRKIRRMGAPIHAHVFILIGFMI